MVITLQDDTPEAQRVKGPEPSHRGCQSRGPEALSHNCPWAQLPQQGQSSPPAVTFSPRSRCLGKGRLELVGTGP